MALPQTPNLASLVESYLKTHSTLLICLSGLSGSGKSYHGAKIAKLLGLSYLDQDDFFNDPKTLPLFQLSTQEWCPNWDCPESLDLDFMNQRIKKLAPKGLLFTGFACRDAWFQIPIDLQIHLEINLETCIQRRQERRIDPVKYAEIIPREIVYPFYLETLAQSRRDVCIDSNSKSSETLSKIMNAIQDKLSSLV